MNGRGLGTSNGIKHHQLLLPPTQASCQTVQGECTDEKKKGNKPQAWTLKEEGSFFSQDLIKRRKVPFTAYIIKNVITNRPECLVAGKFTFLQKNLMCTFGLKAFHTQGNSTHDKTVCTVLS